MRSTPDTPCAVDIDEHLLIRLAGERAYARGLDYFQAGAVTDFRPGRRKTTAIVEGSQTYEVTLEHTAAQFDGYCDCPASEGFDFCKHCVAAALELARRQGLKERMGEGSEEGRVEAYLHSLDKKQLVDLALELIVEDDQRLSRWALRAEAASGALKPAALKKRITKALPYRSLWGYREVRRYFQAAESLLEEVFALLPELPAADALKLVEYAYARLNKALERIDDSGGFRFTVESDLQEQLGVALHRWDRPLADKAGYLLQVIEWPYDVAPELQPLLGEDDALRAELIRQADQLWAQRKGAVSWRLRSLLEGLAEQAGDWDKLIAYKGAAARHFHQFSELVELNLRRQDLEAAESWLQRMRDGAAGWQQAEYRSRQIELLQARGDFAAALDLQWRQFEHSLSVEDYRRVAELSLVAGQDGAACYARAESLLIEQAKARPGPFGQVPSEALIAFYLDQQALEEALAAAQRYPVAVRQLLELGEQAFPSQPTAAFGLYERAILALAEGKKQAIYEDVVRQLRSLESQVQAAGAAELEQRFETLLARLRDSFKRKRNLMKLLEQAFPRAPANR